jgi:hypothetical protein
MNQRLMLQVTLLEPNGSYHDVCEIRVYEDAWIESSWNGIHNPPRHFDSAVPV